MAEQANSVNYFFSDFTVVRLNGKSYTVFPMS